MQTYHGSRVCLQKLRPSFKSRPSPDFPAASADTPHPSSFCLESFGILLMITNATQHLETRGIYAIYWIY